MKEAKSDPNRDFGIGRLTLSEGGSHTKISLSSAAAINAARRLAMSIDVCDTRTPPVLARKRQAVCWKRYYVVPPGRTRTCMHGLSGHCLHPGINRTPNLSATGANNARAQLNCEFAIFVRDGTEDVPWGDRIRFQTFLGACLWDGPSACDYPENAVTFRPSSRRNSHAAASLSRHRVGE